MKPKLGIDVGKILGARGVPDLDLRTKLREQVQQAIPRPPKSVAADTEEQRQAHQCAAAYKQLLASTPIADLVASVVALRRTYVVFYQELQTLILAEREKNPDLPPTMLDFVTQYALFLAGKPFDTTELMAGAMEVFLPILADTVDRHLAAEAKTQQDELRALDVARRAQPLDIGIAYHPAQADTLLDRSRRLTLVGPSPALRWLFKKINERVSKAHNVVWFTTGTINPGDQHVQSLKLAKNAWSGSTKNDKAFDMMLQTFLAPMVTGAIDLVLCDDLSEFEPQLFIGQAPASRANGALRTLSKWCERMGAALISALPYGDLSQPYDLTAAQFEGLKTFSTLRPVTCTPDNDTVRIVVGDHASIHTAAFTDVYS